MRGNCTGDENPDYWYPEMPNGRISHKALKVLTKQTQYALNLCSTCPIKDACLEEGMKTENMRGGIQGWGNLPFGICKYCPWSRLFANTRWAKY